MEPGFARTDTPRARMDVNKMKTNVAPVASVDVFAVVPRASEVGLELLHALLAVRQLRAPQRHLPRQERNLAADLAVLGKRRV